MILCGVLLLEKNISKLYYFSKNIKTLTAYIGTDSSKIYIPIFSFATCSCYSWPINSESSGKKHCGRGKSAFLFLEEVHLAMTLSNKVTNGS